MFLMKHENNLNTLSTLIKAIILMAVPVGLVAAQPDLKNAITLTILYCIIMYAAGLAYKIIGKILLIVVPLFLVVFVLITVV